MGIISFHRLLVTVTYPSWQIYPDVALNFALRFIKTLAIKGRILNQCHLPDQSIADL